MSWCFHEIEWYRGYYPFRLYLVGEERGFFIRAVIFLAEKDAGGNHP